MKVEEFKSKYTKNKNVWQVVELLDEKHKDIIDPYQTQYFDLEMA